MIGFYSLQSENQVTSSGSGSSDLYQGLTKTDGVRYDIAWSEITLKCSGNKFVYYGFKTYGDGSNTTGFTGFRVRPHVGAQNHDTELRMYIQRDGSDIACFDFRSRVQNPVGENGSTFDGLFGTDSVFLLDRPSAGNHTYKAQFYYHANVGTGSGALFQFWYVKAFVKELIF